MSDHYAVDTTALDARRAWIELVETIADWTPDRPMDHDLPERLLALLLAPLPDADPGTLVTLAAKASHTVRNAHYYADQVEWVVTELITAIQDAPRLAGASPSTTAGKGVTGAVEGAAPVTPGDIREVTTVDGRREAWVSDPAPGGWVCAEANADDPARLCGMPVESEPCSIHHPTD